MEHISKLSDDYKHINPWGRKLLRDLAKDYRKLYPNGDLSVTSGVVSAPEQLIGQGVESGPAIGAGEPVRRK